MTSNNISVDFSYTLKNVCRQSRGKKLFNIPSTRLELQQSPYNQYTTRQLDMRRKVEILKYSSNRISTQTNNLTKSQKWANSVSGITSNITSSAIVQDCKVLPTLSSSCDIPGPIFLLYEDANVPLYNFRKPQNAYSIYPDAELLKWSNQVKNNVYISSNTDEIINTVFTRLPSESSVYIFTIQIPLFIYFEANRSNTISKKLELFINSIEIRIYYNDSKISTYDVTSQIPKYTFTNPELNFNTLIKFIGNIKCGDIKLYNEKQYIYDIKLYVNYSLISDNGTITIVKSNIIANYVTTTSNYNAFSFTQTK